MSKPLAAFCTAWVLTVGALPAAADPAPAAQPLVTPADPTAAPKHHGNNSSESRSSLPQAGDIELLLDAPPILNSTNLTPSTVTHGIGVTSSSQFGIGTNFGLGLNAGVGYYVTDVVEIGAAVALDYGQCPVGGTNAGLACLNSGYFEFAAEPFLKLNFGRTLQGAHFNPFAQIGLVAGGEAGTDLGSAILGFDIDLGVDFLISRGWGISVFIPFSMLAATETGGPTVFGFGFGYGLVTYF